MSGEYRGPERRSHPGLGVIHEVLNQIKDDVAAINANLNGKDGLIIRVDRLDQFKAAADKQADRRWQIYAAIVGSGLFSGSAVAAVIKILGN